MADYDYYDEEERKKIEGPDYIPMELREFLS